MVPLAEHAQTDVANTLRQDNIQVIETAHGDVRSALQAAAACDVVVCVLAPTKKTEMDTEEPETYSPEADDVLTALKSQGLPTIVGVAAGSAPDAYRLDIARRFFKDEFGDAVPWCDGAANAPQAVRAAPCRLPRWRQTRARIHVKNASAQGTLLDVEGWVRDAPLALNRLVHVRGVGAARITTCEVYATSQATTPSSTLQGSCD